MIKHTLKTFTTLGLFTLGFALAGCTVKDNTVSVNTNPPVITTQPVSTTVVANSNATFTVVSSGDALVYEWIQESNGAVIAGATSATLTLTSTTTTMNGSKYHCNVKNSKATVTTVTVTLTVTAA